jgi:hypothetical protein
MSERLNKVTKNVYSNLKRKGGVSKSDWNNYINEVDKWVNTKFTSRKQCGG